MTSRQAALPPDDHSHSQFSWDAFEGNMRASCQRAVEIGLPSIAFTEHVDFTVWSAPPGGWNWPVSVRGSHDGHGHFMGLHSRSMPTRPRSSSAVTSSVIW